MPRKRTENSGEEEIKFRRAETAEAREMQMVELADRLAEKQLRDGSASPSLVMHYLKRATVREQLEVERLRKENELADARITQIASAQRVEDLLERAIEAMTEYSPTPPQEIL